MNARGICNFFNSFAKFAPENTTEFHKEESS